MSESLLNVNGAPPAKQYKNVPISTSTFFSGIWTQRSPFGSPDPRQYTRTFGGRTDILIDGSNVELTNYGTLIRRPGMASYSSATLPSGALTFHSFHPISSGISVIADTATNFGTLSSTTYSSLFTKSAGAGQSYFQDVGNTMYIGNGVDQKKWLFAVAWVAGTTYALGSYIIDSNGNIQQVTVAGISGGVQPVWNAATRGNTADNTITWTNRGAQVANWGVSAPSALTVVPPTAPTIFDVRFWAPSHVYGAGGTNLYMIFDITTQSMFLLIDGTKTTGTTYPLFNGIYGSITTDGTATWACCGNQLPALQFYTGVAQGFLPYGSLIDQNGNIQTTLAGGTTAGAGFPVWSAVVGGTVVDGTVTWTCMGSANRLTSGYSWGAAFHTVDGQYSSLSAQTNPIAALGPGPFSATVSGTGTAEGQVDTIAIFRTLNDGSTFFLDSTTANPGAGAWSFTDTALDTALNLLIIGDIVSANAPPQAGLIKMTYHLNRVWGVINNNVYFSALIGDETQIGVGAQCWPTSNVFVFPSTVNRLMPIASGLLVFTTDDIYLIVGSSHLNLFSQLFQQGIGLLSWNALDVEGNQIFMYTSDRQFISFSAAGPSEIGYPIGVDIQNGFSPTQAYVASLIAGTQDKGVFLSDGSAGWYRCNWNQPPEGGPAWSPLASITGGITSVVSVETSPGVHQLLIGQSNGKVLARSYSVFADAGVSYTAFATIGSLVLAKPGQLALLQSIILELQNVGSVPSVSLLLDEISGSFESLVNSVTDPPSLLPSATVMSRRWYLAQGNRPSACRHIQLKVSFAAEPTKNELLTVTAVGALLNEE